MKITDGLHYLTQEQGGHVGAFLLDTGDGLTLIDSLFDTDGKIVLAAIAQMGKQPSDLKRIIHSHAHRSHIGSTAVLKAVTGATVLTHEWEAGIVDGSRKATRVSLWPKPPREAYKLQIGLALGLGKHPPCKVDGTIKEGDRIGPLIAVSTPGHTPGCLSYWWPEKKALFVGDVVVSWPKVEAGWAGLTLDMKENVRSVGKLNEFAGVEYLCVGHGPPVTKDAAGVLAQLKKQPRG
jgi:glyoxylase-like metal-dependent hydrolase (beta-lactamase superfamily II)